MRLRASPFTLVVIAIAIAWLFWIWIFDPLPGGVVRPRGVAVIEIIGLALFPALAVVLAVAALWRRWRRHR